ncbi:Rossmann-like domain-containing protein [Thauera phenolivorans]|uniref:Rossmann-like domain-containing protein n=1 Tax=Thauera phenolivorans TaxID=1792543 RepID=UPI001E351CDA|nr:DUF364 domain-containing protein [Thauera phenolivorans]
MPPSPSPAMRFATDLISLLERSLPAPNPRVRALHLPPPSAIGSKAGEFCALELDDGSIGLSYVLLDDSLARLLDGDAAGAVARMDALELARQFVKGGAAERTLGFAAANALSRTVLDRAGYRPPRGGDSIGGIDPRPGEHIGMIGLFTPLLRRVVDAGARLTVVELEPAWAGDFDGYRVTLDARELEQCDKVLSTSTVLLNDSLDRMLAHCRRARYVALIGPSAGCLPDPLFARGVSAVGGSWIDDGPGMIDALRRGEPWGAFAWKFLIRREDYPGRAAADGSALSAGR